MSDGEIISAFTEEQAANLTGLTVHQLRNWDRTHFFCPSIKPEDTDAPYERVYSFRDLLSLQILGSLRNNIGVSLQHLRRVKDSLAHLKDSLWSRTTLYVLNKRVVFRDKEHDELREAVNPQQIVFPIPLEVVRSNMRSAIQSMNKRDNSELGRIDNKKSIKRNAPVIAGTRISVAAIKQFHEKGFSIAQVLREYPSLTKEDVEAAIRFSSEKTAA